MDYENLAITFWAVIICFVVLSRTQRILQSEGKL